MNILLIYAHPDKESFLSLMKRTFVTAAEEAGNKVIIRDLLDIKFDPILGYNDLKRIRQGKVSNDVKQEQDFIDWADLLVVMYPVWYMSMPAVIKGYFDRVFTKGFAFRFDGSTVHGLLENKRVFLISTSGLDKSLYDTMYLIENLNHIVDYGIFEFCGMEVVAHEYFWSIPFLSEEEKENILKEIKKWALKL